jgi:ubiquinone/menaquinone biosynthesis C-methylase UbiE
MSSPSAPAESCADFPDPASVDPEVYARKQRAFARVPREARRILDVGSGTGDDVLALAEQTGAEAEVVGLERSPALVEEASRRARNVALNVRFVVGDAELLPFADASFDVVHADRLLSSLSSWERAMREMVRVLSPGGRLVIVEADPRLLQNAPVDGLALCAWLHDAGLRDSDFSEHMTEGARTFQLVAEKGVRDDAPGEALRADGPSPSFEKLR